jgi:hypothetical protein
MTKKAEILEFVQARSDIDINSICPHCVEMAKELSALIDSLIDSVPSDERDEDNVHGTYREGVIDGWNRHCNEVTKWKTEHKGGV